MENNNSRLQNLIQKANSFYESYDYECAIDYYNKLLQIIPKDTDTDTLYNKVATY